MIKLFQSNARFRLFIRNMFLSITYQLAKIIIYLNKVRSLIYSSNFNEDSKIVILKPDALGDYILFRNYIYCIKNKYKNEKIFIVGNKIWEEIATHYDSSEIDHFIFINRNLFFKKIIYRTKFLVKFSQLKNVKSVIYPCYSYEDRCILDIVKIINSSSKVAWRGDKLNIREPNDINYAKLFNLLFESNKKIEFEFVRNRLFFEYFLGDNLNQIKLELPRLEDTRLELPERFAFVFIGASASFRQWPAVHFAKVAQYLNDIYGLSIIIGGGPNDTQLGNHIYELISSSCECINFVGKTNQIQLIELIQRSNLLLSNETAIPHIAVALGHNNVFVVSNGNHYGRFTPYPEQIFGKYFSVYPDEIEKISSESVRIEAFGMGSRLDIKTISPEKVINKISNNFLQ